MPAAVQAALQQAVQAAGTPVQPALDVWDTFIDELQPTRVDYVKQAKFRPKEGTWQVIDDQSLRQFRPQVIQITRYGRKRGQTEGDDVAAGGAADQDRQLGGGSTSGSWLQ